MKNKFADYIRYQFDNAMSKGTVSLVKMLFLLTALVVFVAGLFLFLTSDERLAVSVWTSIMHVIDPGTITGDSPENIAFLVSMSIVTLCGIFITSVLISIITTGFREKLDELKQGTGRIVEKDHTLILGYNENTYTIISEIIEANANQKDACIVLLANKDMEVVKREITKWITDFKTVRIIYRNGVISDANTLWQCSIETAKCVIINPEDDFVVTQTTLAIRDYFSSINDENFKPHIVATVNEPTNFEAIRIAGGKHIELILANDMIARIIAQVCRQPGLSKFFIELFNFKDNELYFEYFPELIGRRFGDVLMLFENSVVFGVFRDGEILLNADNDYILKENDKLIIFAEDDGISKPLKTMPSISNIENLIHTKPKQANCSNILVIGVNDMLESILSELNHFYDVGTRIIIADTNIDTYDFSYKQSLENLTIETIVCNTNHRTSLENVIKQDIDHILVLSSDCDSIKSDAMNLLKLIHIRDIAEKEHMNFSITSEFLNTRNQQLAQVTKANDLVVGSDIINLILSQISENRALSAVFSELLSYEGSEIYLKDVSYYFKPQKELDFYMVTEIVKRHGEIAVGYTKQDGDSFKLVTNPKKSDKIIFGEHDQIIVLCAN